ncbi:class I adenylate-forming enzyme family protein [Pseudoduganella namucuonensis]|uniref:Acyl-CoA synthetase (AMP-forming)/AMP-acid ligase II n=1 Tax=Pseudoduganella namucuonensis TaxID=1035707 RepID=A0A1I7JGL0_9BURK|nr:class I adenylate-forming enzyme family protein [Pseudoduganella namucuonensis]SFU84311.1 Acyl-CoA synthetase (AMP-forming)/AMP-acid ligase II [Pseudoduganella namucuonensis]
MDVATLLASLPARISDIPRLRAEAAPDAPALSEDGRIVTYGELAAAMDAAAARLRALGVRAGDRVMIVGENSVAQITLIFACAAIDAWAVNVNARLSEREVDQFRDHSGARLLVYTDAVSSEAAGHARRHGAGVAGRTGGASPGTDTRSTSHELAEACGAECLSPGARRGGAPAVEAWTAGPLSQAAVQEPVFADGARQAAALIYTTGTTGLSKGVMLSHRNLLFIAAVSSALRGLAPGDRVYGVLPISHVYGLASVMLGTLYAGACLYLQPRFSVEALLRALRHDRLTIVQGVPAMYARLLETLGGAETPLATDLRFAYAGGSPLDPLLKRQVEKLLGQPLHNGYGMTESSPTISQTRLDAPRDDTSVGYAIPGIEVRIDDGGDGVGELLVRGPNVMLGYYKEPALTAAAIDADGWLRTGDVARRDGDGALFIVGRAKELIIHSGFNVYPLEVETVLNAHPDVVQSAVVGIGVANGEEEVIAFVEPHPRRKGDAAELLEELRAHAASRLAHYKCPARIIMMEALPAAATGKILKGRLRQMAQEMAQDQITENPHD